MTVKVSSTDMCGLMTLSLLGNLLQGSMVELGYENRVADTLNLLILQTFHAICYDLHVISSAKWLICKNSIPVMNVMGCTLCPHSLDKYSRTIIYASKLRVLPLYHSYKCTCSKQWISIHH